MINAATCSRCGHPYNPESKCECWELLTDGQLEFLRELKAAQAALRAAGTCSCMHGGVGRWPDSECPEHGETANRDRKLLVAHLFDRVAALLEPDRS